LWLDGVYGGEPGRGRPEFHAQQEVNDADVQPLVQRIRAIPGGFETDDTVTLRTRRVPASDYPAFRAALLAIDRALERKVVVKP
jgi:hypothetical protein